MHDFHDVLPGYHPDQLLHDGCVECERRAAADSHGINELDVDRFAHAWRRAARWSTVGLSNVSTTEAPMLNALWAVQVQLERRGVSIGELP